jgi:gas vesicle protein
MNRKDALTAGFRTGLWIGAILGASVALLLAFVTDAPAGEDWRANYVWMFPAGAVIGAITGAVIGMLIADQRHPP